MFRNLKHFINKRHSSIVPPIRTYSDVPMASRENGDKVTPFHSINELVEFKDVRYHSGMLDGNVARARFIYETFKHTAKGVGITVGLSSTLAYLIPQAIMESSGLFIGLPIAGLVVGLVAVTKLQSTKIRDFPMIMEKDGRLQPYSPINRTRDAYFNSLSVAMGLSCTPLFQIVGFVNPWIIPLSLVITTGIFYGCARIAFNSGSEIKKWKTPLVTGLIAILGVQLVGLVAMFVGGPLASLATICHTIDIYAGIGLFTLFAIYDFHKIERSWNKGRPDHVWVATSLFLDFINLLIRIMEAMAQQNKHK